MARVIVNADDFGLNLSCTKAICQSFAEGLITDTTMVANGNAWDEAISGIKAYEIQDCVGIHFNITDGKPLTHPIESMPNFTNNGVFHGKINRLRWINKDERKAIYKEFSAQIERFEKAGIKVSHADSHHHIHTAVFIAPVFARVCKEHGIKKVRIHRNIGRISMKKRIVKKVYNIWLHMNGFTTTTFFGSMEDVKMVGIMDDLEIMVHPDYDKNGVLIDRIYEKSGFVLEERLALPGGKLELKGYRDL